MNQATSGVSLNDALSAARDTRALELGAGVLNRTPEVFRAQFGQQPAVLVADQNTWTAAGQAVAAAFEAAGHPMRPPYVLRSPNLYAEHRFVAELETVLGANEAIPVAVGSGTINDLTKLAAHRVGRPYLCVATAASMDGYTAFGASITFEELKQTFMCPAPRAVVADLNVVAAAPDPMNAWGYADLLAKFPAGADWILADALGVEPIDPRAWGIVQGRLRDLTADPAGIPRRDPAALGRLLEGLMLGGFAMQWAQSSRPASGAEHQFSHLWDMQHHTHNGRTPSHGFKVGIGTLAITALYERLFEQPLERLDVAACCAAWPEVETWVARARQWLGDVRLADGAARELRAKHVAPAQLREQLEKLRTVWPNLRERLRAQLLPFSTLRQMLQTVGAPIEPEQIGISRDRLRRSFWQAFCIRRRFTVLDLAVRTGLLEDCLNHIFGPTGVWPLPQGSRASDMQQQ